MPLVDTKPFMTTAHESLFQRNAAESPMMPAPMRPLCERLVSWPPETPTLVNVPAAAWPAMKVDNKAAGSEKRIVFESLGGSGDGAGIAHGGSPHAGGRAVSTCEIPAYLVFEAVREDRV